MQKGRPHIIARDSPQGRLKQIQSGTLPYLIIIGFAICSTIARFYMVPEWTPTFQLQMFFVQAFVLSCVWTYVKDLNRRLEKTLPFENGAVKRMAVQIGLTFAGVTPVMGIIVYVLKPRLPHYFNTQFFALTIILFVAIIFLFNFVFYAFYFFTNWQRSVEEKASLEIQAAELEKEKFNLQYHQLKNQVNPHYLFNTLTSLDGLIHTNPDLASDFVRHMAKVYRYVLQHKENEVVSLDEELEFIRHYINLLHIRYGQGLNIHYTISDAAKERGIVMVTLQMLIDNAVKHNIVQASTPLKVIIWDEGDYLIVHNNKQLRTQIETSNGQGIVQLKQLYAFLSDKSILIEDNKEHYTIKIPLL